MNGVHDMGGMHGFGPIERDETVFHAEWEAHVSAMQTLTGRGRYFNLDVDAVEQGPGQAALVAQHRIGRATTGSTRARECAQIAARAGVHGRDQ